NPAAVERLHGAQIVEPDSAIVLRLDNGLLKSLAGRATNVECAHRQLRSGLADLLGGDDSHSFAKLNELAGGEVASITHRAYSATALTSKNGTNLQTFHAHPLKLAGDLLINELIRFDDFFLLIHRISDCLATDTPIMRWARSTTSSSPS